MSRILGFDYGKVRIGVSYSDESKLIASSLDVFIRQKNLEFTFREIQKKGAHLFPIELFVVGYPLLLNGKEGEMALETKQFAESLSAYFSVPFVLWDERLSSTQAEKIMKEGNLSRKQRAGLSDTLASRLILQNYLECHGFKTIR